jgi:hypothetical protein
MQQLQETTIRTEQIESRKEQAIATILGKSTFQQIDWRMLMQEGVMVRVVIRRCRFTAKLELSDLGVTIQDARARQAISRTLVLGEKRLLPELYMASLSRVESGARRLLAKNSFHTELGSFIPVTAYDAWKSETEGCKTRYFALRDEIIDKHEELVEQILAEYKIVARDTYRRIQEVSPDVLTESEEAFVLSYCERIIALIPDKDRILESFGFDIELVDGVKRMNELTEEDAASVVPARQVQPEQLRSQAGARDWQREQMQRDLLQQAQQKKKSAVDAFLTTIVTHLSSLAYDAMTDVLASMERRDDGKFPPRSIIQLKNLVAQISQLNFYGDQDLERAMTQIQVIIDQEPSKRQRNLADIREKLCAIATVARATLLDLEQEPRSARSLDIPDAPTETYVREARKELGLDLDEMAFLQLTQVRGERIAEQISLFDWEEEEGRTQRLA